MKSKTVKVKSGIFLRKSANGFSMHIHATNGNKLAVLTGYNTKQAAHKGLDAVHDVLVNSVIGSKGKNQTIYKVIDLTAPKKKAVKSTTKKKPAYFQGR